jgi:lipopolysaccharide transport system ATP-binding protein
MKPIIKIERLGKLYRIGTHRSPGTLRDAIAEMARAPFKSALQRNHKSDLWALKEVDLEVTPGEVVGIIGRNGAGKSTLLKILSRITSPTEGHVALYGRVSSLLEVGTGFHSELSGRENIFLNGAIMGMSRTEIVAKFDEIVAFAGIDEFLDTPVKHYSSGMYVRLAFAVAAHLESDILVVDEVLAVGDVEFQKKCLNKINDVARSGRTILFVSHNLAAVENLCSSGIVLEEGRVKFAGTQKDAISHYLTSSLSSSDSMLERNDRVGSGEIRIVSVEMKDLQGRPLDVLASGQDVDIFLNFENKGMSSKVEVIAALIVRTQLEVPVFLQHNRLTGTAFGALPERGAFVCRLNRLPLPPATYRFGFSLMSNGEYIDAIDPAGEFTVTAGDFFGSGEVPPSTHGCALVDASWRLVAAGNTKGYGQNTLSS